MPASGTPGQVFCNSLSLTTADWTIMMALTVAYEVVMLLYQ